MPTKKGNTFAQISFYAFTFNSFVSNNITCMSYMILTTYWPPEILSSFYIMKSVQCVLYFQLGLILIELLNHTKQGNLIELYSYLPILISIIQFVFYMQHHSTKEDVNDN